jgi:hypothetical protein
VRQWPLNQRFEAAYAGLRIGHGVEVGRTASVMRVAEGFLEEMKLAAARASRLWTEC